MATSTDIANLALSHLGQGVQIADLDTENSPEAKACRQFYTQARQQTLRDFEWPVATKIAALGLVTEDPNDEWAYSYEYPSDCLEMRRILSGTRNDSRQSKIPYRVVYGTAGAEIYTDRYQAEAEYTVDVTETGRLPGDLIMAMSFRLASYIAPRVTKGDPFKLSLKCLQMYQLEITKAQANAIKDEQPEQVPDAETIRGRE